jgi:protein-tyrosine phosphatase
MIDLHNHILPGLDDGARTSEESMQMCRISYRDGVRTIVATPHTLGSYENDRSAIVSKVRELNEAIAECGLQNAECGVEKDSNSAIRIPNSEFRILPGADVHLCERTLLHFDQGRLTTINDGGRFLLIEFPSQGIPHRAEEVLFQLMARGIIPVITHPERNLGIGQNPKRYYEMIRAGCLGQVTAMSVTGEFGPKVRKVAEQLLTNRLVHFIASDAHSANGRPPVLSSAVRVVERLLGEEEARRMVTEYPQAVLEGIRPQVPEPKLV